MKKVIGFISVFVACFAFLFVIASCDNSNSNPDITVNPGTDDDVYYTITFKDYDGTILQSSSVKKGETPTFNKSNPTRISNDNYSYEFKGWNPAITVVNEDAEYIATYNEFINEYIITWKNYDGEVLEVDQNVPYGTVPEYNGVKPQKSNTEEFAYSFTGWDKEITSVTSDTTYIANYEVYSLGLEYTLNASKNEYSVSGNSVNTNEIIIPSNYNGLPVTSIGSSAFENCSSLTNITLPNSITSIERRAFYNCTSLTSIIIPESVTGIEYGAFGGCSSLTSIIVNSNNKVFDSRNNCNAIINTSTNTLIVGCKNTTIPDSVTSIGESAFQDCSSLTSITIPESVTSIGKFAFSYCSSLTSITIPDSVTSIEYGAFGSCSSLTNITLPNSITSIGKFAFSYCSSLTNITLPNSITNIEFRAFYNCTSLTSITIPESVTSIGESAFENCTSLTSITIPESVTSIGKDAFLMCCRLVEVINKSSLSITLGSTDNGYIGCYAKQIITDESNSKLSTDENGFITYNDGIDIWLFNYIGNSTEIVISNNVTKIYDFAFSYCSSLTSITIPDSVTSIGERAFWYCDSLTSITIPDSVTSIREDAFYYCTSLTSIIIPESVTSIEWQAFYYCSSLTKVYYKGTSSYTDTITSIEDCNQSLTSATWYYFTSNGANETNSGNWWYYDTDGITIIEKVIS